MKQTIKRSLAMFIVLVMLVAFVPALCLSASAAEFSYVYASNGKYIYNWGTRGTTATSLSPNAKDFYEDNGTSYAELSSYSGGSGKSDAPKSDLYRELKKLMVDNHSYITSYSATKDLYQYTDCQNSGGKISSFYSGKAIGPTWDGGWNREHTWPNSKGLGGSDENDLMMLRPTSTSENSSRGNTAYGQSSGYYNPNKESGGKYDLRGDVARIFLYVYVRWGNTGSTAWGTSGVMESVAVLLEWMEADPVDTWELGRNDSVESITGTRNVFVDYPELAFLLFGEEIPADMTTPSGESGNKCTHNNFGTGTVTPATCTEKGYTLYVCQVAGCGYSYKDNIVDAKGHNYVSDVCSVCGESKTAEPTKPTYVTEFETGKAYKLGLFSSALSAEYYFNGTMKGYYGATDTAYTNAVDVYVENATGGYRLYFKDDNGAKQYINLVASGTYRNFTFATSATSVYTWDAAKSTFKTTVEGEVCYIGTYGSYYTMGVLQTSKLSDTDYFARLYTMGGDAGNTPSTPPTDDPVTPPTCQHNYTKVVTAPTCTAGGFTTYTCTLCGNNYVGDKTTAKGHSYTNGTCTTCGATEPVGGTATQATIKFDNTANRTVFTTSQQVWVQNGITVTNDKASATSSVADYSNPVRFYQGSNVTIAYPGMTKLVIDCTGMESKYVGSWLNVTGATATNDNNIITIVFDSPTDSITYTNLTKQSRAYSITVYSGSSSQPIEPPTECTHTNTTVVGATQATCTTKGFTGKTVCSQCNNILDEGNIIAALGHNDSNNDGICDACGEKLAADVHVYTEWAVVKAPTCTEAGSERRNCTHCSDYETREIAALGHSDANNDTVCDACGEKLSANVHVYAEWVVIRKPTCTTAGLERRDCDHCSDYETREVAALGHNDANNDGICDTCGEKSAEEEITPDTPNTPEEDKEEHVCEEVSGFKAFINSIINFFRRLFGQPELCACGETIKEKE